MGIGWTLGEEILYSEDNNTAITRMEKCEALSEACVLTLKVQDLINMAEKKAATGGGGTLKPDYLILLSFLEKNHDCKTQWRQDNGLLDDNIKETSDSENKWIYKVILYEIQYNLYIKYFYDFNLFLKINL